MSAITVEGDLVHYEKLGRGRPVILLHGWIGSWRYWIPTMQVLQAKFSVYALDLYGFGDSAKNGAKYTLDKQVDLLSAFVREMGIPKAAFVAHGLGAVVVTEFARRNPDKVARVLYVSAPLFEPSGLSDRNPPGALRALSAPPLAMPSPAVAPTVAPSVPSPSTNVSDATLPSTSGVDRAALARAYAVLANSSGSDAPKPRLSVTDALKPPTPPSNSAPTVPNPIPSAAQVAAARPLTEIALGRSGDNPLVDALSGDLESLLAKCFKRSEPEFEKLRTDLSKIDISALKSSTFGFDSLEMLDKLHVLEMPMVFVHGQDDPIITNPRDEVWLYLARTKTEDKLLPIPLPGVRHFPMLENDRFSRLVTDFLEKADISTIEVLERWKRRSR
jgi:pimeloyl-ACP methyl ester carboxylesterase